MSAAAAAHGAGSLRQAIRQRGKARLVAATGASQLEFLAALTSMPDIDWPRVELFHLDEYVGIRENHRASFRRYLRENLIDRTGISTYHFLDAERDVDDCQEACRSGAGPRGRGRDVCRDRRERPPRVQRSAGRLRHDGALHRRHARRGLPAAAGR